MQHSVLTHDATSTWNGHHIVANACRAKVSLAALVPYLVEREELDVLAALVENVPSLSPHTAADVTARLQEAAVATGQLGWQGSWTAAQVRLDTQQHRVRQSLHQAPTHLCTC
jgi:hypothetical protein